MADSKKFISRDDAGKASRVRKGGHNELARNARNVSRYNEISKEEEDMVTNLPTNINTKGMSSSSDSSEEPPRRDIVKPSDSKAKTNKKFELKEINHELVVQKYEDIMNGTESRLKEGEQDEGEGDVDVDADLDKLEEEEERLSKEDEEEKRWR